MLLFTGIKIALIVVALAMLVVGWLLYKTLSAVKLDAEDKRPYGLTAIEFAEQTIVIAKDQPEYRPLPAYIREGTEGIRITCWQLSPLDRLKLLLTGKLWCSVWTFNQTLQPLFFSVNKADMGFESK
ncbi:MULTISPECIES: hypothetical protein [unclassified Spirosoma]|uniref:hypothetical protein n=1 Tax=unclassified Spirosoma TaxID=2621999 RepID=UPI00095F3BBD|nr:MULTISPECIES: hypothetical protein [unclassified Spirosoma]MBN8821306.1 hypothetical protein [Spirosoma sp.]OJW78095.1 MAG: hypothetical protein BGO59_29185 [Spirosoma sp. 48-14]